MHEADNDEVLSSENDEAFHFIPVKNDENDDEMTRGEGIISELVEDTFTCRKCSVSNLMTIGLLYTTVLK